MLGASFDRPEDNKAFADAQGFGFRLLSDADRRVGRDYEAERPAGDPLADYPLRIAYLIDADGMVRRSYEVSDTAGFAGMVIDDLATLAG